MHFRNFPTVAVGQVPIYYNMKNTGRPYTPEKDDQKYVSRYLATPNEPLYPFGYGLSYTIFAYSGIGLDRTEIRPAELPGLVEDRGGIHNPIDDPELQA